MRALRLFALVLISLGVAFALASSARATPPANDDFDAATVVTTLPFSDSVNTVEATTASDDPGGCWINNSVWYRFTPARDMTVDINPAGSTYDAIMGLYTGTRGSLQNIDCGRRLLSALQAGVTYYLMVNSCCYYGGPGGGDLTLSINEALPPSNDDWDTATTVTGVPFEVTESTLLATTAPDDDFFWSKKTVWFSFTPSESRRVAISTIGSDYQTDVAVYTGTRSSRGFATCDYPTSGVQWCNVEAGTTYHVVVSAAYAFGGTLAFSVLDLPTAALTVDHIAVTGLPGNPTLVRISGTAVCNQPMGMSYEAWFIQGNYSSVVDGQLACSPAGEPWTAYLQDYGYFTLGAGTVSMTASGGSAAGPAFASAAAPVVLTRYVSDTTPPTLSMPAGLVVDASTPAGTVVSYAVSATDNVDPSPTVVCTPVSGSTFPIGTTTVNCTASDAAGNVANGSFTVKVRGGADQLADLAIAVKGVGPGKSLADTVAAARLLLAHGQTHLACVALTAFNLEVKAQSGKKIPKAQATALIADATRIKTVLGC